MAKNFCCWVIVVGNQPTAFRAREAEDLVPTLKQLQRTQPDVEMRWFERNRSTLGPPGLFAEEFDVVQRQLRGNLPQAFVHALLVESARRLADRPVATPDPLDLPSKGSHACRSTS